MKQPKITIRLNQNIADVKCENNGIEYSSAFAEGEVFVCECALSEIADNQQYVASTDQWEKVYLPVEACDQLSIKITKQF